MSHEQLKNITPSKSDWSCTKKHCTKEFKDKIKLLPDLDPAKEFTHCSNTDCCGVIVKSIRGWTCESCKSWFCDGCAEYEINCHWSRDDDIIYCNDCKI